MYALRSRSETAPCSTKQLKWFGYHSHSKGDTPSCPSGVQATHSCFRHGHTRFCARFTTIHNMHIKRGRRLRDGAPAPWEADTNAYKQRFWCHDRPRSEKNGGFGYARGIFHEETMSVYR